MNAQERKQNTYIGSAEIRLENTARRDNLVNAAKAAGFIAEYAEAIGISFSGATTPSYWSITVYATGILNPVEKNEKRRALAAAWKGL